MQLFKLVGCVVKGYFTVSCSNNEGSEIICELKTGDSSFIAFAYSNFFVENHIPNFHSEIFSSTNELQIVNTGHECQLHNHTSVTNKVVCLKPFFNIENFNMRVCSTHGKIAIAGVETNLKAHLIWCLETLDVFFNRPEFS